MLGGLYRVYKETGMIKPKEKKDVSYLIKKLEFMLTRVSMIYIIKKEFEYVKLLNKKISFDAEDKKVNIEELKKYFEENRKIQVDLFNLEILHHCYMTNFKHEDLSGFGSILSHNEIENYSDYSLMIEIEKLKSLLETIKNDYVNLNYGMKQWIIRNESRIGAISEAVSKNISMDIIKMTA